MAFEYAINQRPISVGNKRVSYGTFKAGGDSSGVIDTGLRVCEFIGFTLKGESGASKGVTVSNLPSGDGKVTVNFGTATTLEGYWKAEGY